MTAKQKVRDAVLALIRAQIDATDGSNPGGRNMLYLANGPTGEQFTVSLTFGYGYFDGDSVMIYRGEEMVTNPNPAKPDRADELFGKETL